MITTIYKVETKMRNPERQHSDLYTNYDEAMSYYNGVKENQNCESIEVMKLQNSEDFSLLKCVEVVASYS